MKISIFSYISTAFLIIIAISLFWIIKWSSHEQTQTQLTQKAYLELQKKLENVFEQHINDYLASGNTLKLTTAENELLAIKSKITEQNATYLNLTVVEIDKLLIILSGDLRSTGKISANLYQLLTHAENELSSYSLDLIEYGEKNKALNPALANKYQLKGARLIVDIAQLRSKRFELFQQQLIHQSDINQFSLYVNSIKEHVAHINQLKRLGVYEAEDVDDFELMFTDLSDENTSDKSTQEEVADKLTSEINSLLNRYPTEIENTFSNKVRVDNTLNTLKTAMIDVNSAFKNAEMVLNVQVEDVNNTVFNSLNFFAVLLVIMAITLSIFQYTLIIKRIRVLSQAFSKLAQHGELSKLKVTTSKSEINTVFINFNHIVDLLNTEQSNKESKLSDITASLSDLVTDSEKVKQATLSIVTELKSSSKLTLKLKTLAEDVFEGANSVQKDAIKTQNSIEDSNQKIKHVSQHTRMISTAVKQSQDSADNLLNSVEDVSSIVATISSIADQTNLLALNAAIEAARAGEYGRGFAVVADEVRMLSQSTQTSLTEIINILGKLKSSSTVLSDTVEGIKDLSNKQETITHELANNALEVMDKAHSSANAASQCVRNAKKQVEYLVIFQQDVESISQSAISSNHLVQEISEQTKYQTDSIVNTLAS